jgi:hypothetical protein
MAMGGEGTGKVNPMHQSAAKQRAQWIRVIRQHNFVHLRLRVAHRPWH